MSGPLAALAGLLSLALAAGASALAADDPAEILRRQTQELLDAITNGSAAVWERYLDKDARYVDESGSVLTKKQMVDDIHPPPEGVSGSIRLTQFDVTMHGDVAIATYVDDENEDFHGHKLHCQYRSTDTWMKTPGGWRLISGQILALRTDPPPISLSASLRQEYCGLYALSPTLTYEIRCPGDALEGQQTGRKTEELRAEAPDVLFVPGHPRYRYVFLRGADGRITGLAQRREAWDLIWKRVAPESPGRPDR